MPVMGLGCCLWLLGAGALAVWLYQRRVPGTFVTPGMGMRIGAVSGAIGYVATTIWSVLRFASNSQEFRTAMQEQMDKSLAANPDPRAQEIMRQFMGNLNTPQGLATFFVLVLVIMARRFRDLQRRRRSARRLHVRSPPRLPLDRPRRMNLPCRHGCRGRKSASRRSNAVEGLLSREFTACSSTSGIPASAWLVALNALMPRSAAA